MNDTPKSTWTGASGKEYAYFVCNLSFSPTADQDGNYIFAKDVAGYFQVVYIGQGDLASRKAAHLADGCVTQKGATHFLCHIKKNRRSRLAEEDDLLQAYLEAYAPSGCNQKLGG
jgi:hypothetical protein